jgi:hypothetical protein
VSKPYRVEHGRGLEAFGEFATFAEALAYFQGVHWGYFYSNATGGVEARIVNTDNIDGADDASPAAQHGLTEQEWERVQEIG